ncbi:thiol-disulfide oxidoreductase DCC family protein [Bacillus alkalicellulosilyticus]|uniref:thiol-disulfide oxidoreductase DCC family protein n=1 Tax=Alkalihalobacterium alkalicellulosilyticum TaxID=1912214 RepID=UPI000997EF32|nr:thiol-disulfide oxidoreductase DCC family protein [Bacillus alkalicellulosilyticus]
MRETNEHQIVLFDGVCNMCNSLVTFLIKRDPEGMFQYAALQSDAGQKLLQQYGLPTNDFGSFILIKKGKFYTKSSAALHVLKELKGAWKLLYPLIIVPRPIRDFVYSLIAHNRYRLFGKKQECMIPTPELKKRFL